MMRRIIANLLISLDGVVEEPGDWHFPYFNDEMGAAVDAVLSSAWTYKRWPWWPAPGLCWSLPRSPRSERPRAEPSATTRGV
jgi:hypothetical protein